MNKELQKIITRINSEKRLRVWSVILTFFGDAIVPRGEFVSAQIITKLIRELSIEDGAVRTALSRLANDGWVTRKKYGRSSYYSLSQRGHTPFAEAASKIYTIPQINKSDAWTLAIVQTNNKSAFEKLLTQYSGFMLETNMFVFNTSSNVLLDQLESLDCLITTGTNKKTPLWLNGHSKLRLLAKDFENFKTIFENLPTDLPQIEAMAARCLLIHEWRRLILRMPDVPIQFLPNHWPAETCGKLVSQKYKALLAQSEEWMRLEGNKTADSTVSDRFNTLQN